jgi:predicted ribonuclease YlaK
MFEVETIEVPKSTINKLCKEGVITSEKIGQIPVYSKYVNLKCNSQSAVGYLRPDNQLELINTKDLGFQNIRPKDLEQNCFMWGLKNKPVNFCLGAAGTGKTTIALSYALHSLFRDEKKVVLCKPTVFVGSKSNAIAAVPGDERDKLRPYVDSYMPGLEKILGRDCPNFLYQWEESGQLQFRSVELMRGQHFENSIIILDEAQNLSLHELCSVISRVGQDSTIIVLGDPAQIDTGGKWHDTGLYMFADSDAVSHSNLVSLVKLAKQYRGPIAQLCSRVLEEYNPLDEEDFVVSLKDMLPINKSSSPYAIIPTLLK